MCLFGGFVIGLWLGGEEKVEGKRGGRFCGQEEKGDTVLQWRKLRRS